jgi:hypothetical protein
MADMEREQMMAGADGLKSSHYVNSNDLAQEFDKNGLIMSGIQLDDEQKFKRRQLKTGGDFEIHVIPIIVDFRNLMMSQSTTEILRGVSISCQ